MHARVSKASKRAAEAAMPPAAAEACLGGHEKIKTKSCFSKFVSLKIVLHVFKKKEEVLQECLSQKTAKNQEKSLRI